MAEPTDFNIVDYLSGIGSKGRSNLLKALQTTPPNLSVAQFSIAVAKQAELEPSGVHRLCLELSGWFKLIGDDVAFLPLVANHIVTGQIQPAEEPSGIHAELRDFIQSMLRCDQTLGVTLKANEVMWREERVFDSVAITTEVRPIYGHDLMAHPENAVIIHQLRLTYKSGGIENAFFVAMSLDEVRILQRALERAVQKEDTLVRAGAYRYLGKER